MCQGEQPKRNALFTLHIVFTITQSKIRGTQRSADKDFPCFGSSRRVSWYSNTTFRRSFCFTFRPSKWRRAAASSETIQSTRCDIPRRGWCVVSYCIVPDTSFGQTRTPWVKWKRWWLWWWGGGHDDDDDDNNNNNNNNNGHHNYSSKSGYNTYRGWTQIEYQNKHYNIHVGQKIKGTLDDPRRDGGTNFILRIKEQETRLILHEHDDDDDDDELILNTSRQFDSFHTLVMFHGSVQRRRNYMFPCLQFFFLQELISNIRYGLRYVGPHMCSCFSALLMFCFTKAKKLANSTCSSWWSVIPEKRETELDEIWQKLASSTCSSWWSVIPEKRETIGRNLTKASTLNIRLGIHWKHINMSFNIRTNNQ